MLLLHTGHPGTGEQMEKKQRTSNLNYNNGTNLARSVQATLEHGPRLAPLLRLALSHFDRGRPSSIICSTRFLHG